MTYRIEIDSAAVAALLAVDLRRAIETAALGIAAEIQDTVAPYPPAPPRRAGQGYYVRGRGSFTARGELVKPSELLNRRWSIKAVPLGARLRNTASYAGKVHGRKQAKIHKKHGWVTVETGIERVRSSGEARRLMMRALAQARRRG